MYNRVGTDTYNAVISLLDKNNNLIFPDINATTTEPINKNTTSKFDFYHGYKCNSGCYIAVSNLEIDFCNISSIGDCSNDLSDPENSLTVRNIIGQGYKSAFGVPLDYSKITGEYKADTDGTGYCEMNVEGKKCEELVFHYDFLSGQCPLAPSDCFYLDLFDKPEIITQGITAHNIETKSKIKTI